MSLDDYLPECEYFCRRDYLVLAFDGSGTGHSDGILRGLPQHILDLQPASGISVQTRSWAIFRCCSTAIPGAATA